MNSRVLLIFPKFRTGPEIRPERPPLGVLTVAAPLIEKGIEVVILDERIENNFDHKLINELQRKPVCVGISSMSGRHITQALRISKLVKEYSKIPVIWGGVHASLAPKSTIEHPLIDLIVRDDGEEIFTRLVDTIINHPRELGKIDGIAYKNNGTIVFTNEAKPADIEKLPPVPFHLIDFNKYGPDPGSRDYTWTSSPKHIIPMETSRGCPFSCSFCTESVRKKKWRSLSPERIISEIKYYIREYGIYNFTFIDDNLFGNIKRGEEIIKLLAQESLGINWYSNIRTDYMAKANPLFIRNLEKSGCRMLTFGAESGSERILKMINKNATAGDVIDTNRKLAKSDIISHFVTIRGFPSETKAEIAKTYLLISKLLLDNQKTICSSPCLIPTPSTYIAAMCLGDIEKGYSLEDWAKSFDIFNKKKPSWVLDETYDFMYTHSFFFTLINQINGSSKTKSALSRVILRVYRNSLMLGYSKQLDWFLRAVVALLLAKKRKL